MQSMEWFNLKNRNVSLFYLLKMGRLSRARLWTLETVIQFSETFRKQKVKENIFVTVLAFIFTPLWPKFIMRVTKTFYDILMHTILSFWTSNYVGVKPKCAFESLFIDARQTGYAVSIFHKSSSYWTDIFLCFCLERSGRCIIGTAFNCSVY